MTQTFVMSCHVMDCIVNPTNRIKSVQKTISYKPKKKRDGTV